MYLFFIKNSNIWKSILVNFYSQMKKDNNLFDLKIINKSMTNKNNNNNKRK